MERGSRSHHFRSLSQSVVDSDLNRYTQMTPEKALVVFKKRLEREAKRSAKNGHDGTIVDWNRGNQVAHRNVLSRYLDQEGFWHDWFKWSGDRWRCQIKWVKEEEKSVVEEFSDNDEVY